MVDAANYDLDSIEGCEEAFNHYLGQIKTVLDRGDKKFRLLKWQFTVVAVAFVDGTLQWCPSMIQFVWSQFQNFILFCNEKHEEFIDDNDQG